MEIWQCEKYTERKTFSNKTSWTCYSLLSCIHPLRTQIPIQTNTWLFLCSSVTFTQVMYSEESCWLEYILCIYLLNLHYWQIQIKPRACPLSVWWGHKVKSTWLIPSSSFQALLWQIGNLKCYLNTDASLLCIKEVKLLP